MGSSNWLDLNVRGRTVLAGVYLAVQVALVASSPARPDGVFSFRMFNESSTIAIHLSRKVLGADGREAIVRTDGRWQARDEGGERTWFAWTDRIHDPILATLDREVHAAYGVDAQLFRLQRALDDAMGHASQDAETLALVADVDVRRNGREATVRHLESAPRSK